MRTRLLTALLASVVLLGLLLVAADLERRATADAVGEVFADLSWPLVLLAFALYAGSYGGRALRLAALLPGAPAFGRLCSVSARHNLLNLVLPFRSGEASLPLMLKAEAGRPLAEGVAALLVARVLDLLCVTSYFLLGGALRAGGGQDAHAPRVALVLAGVLCALVVMRPGARWLARATLSEGRVGGFVQRLAGHVGTVGTRRLAGATAVSFLTWGLTYAACYALVLAMAGPGPVGTALARVSVADSLVGSSLLHLTAILPINTIAGAGAWEAGWTAGYVLAGVDEIAAFASAVGSHVLIFAFIALLGGLAFLRRRGTRA